MGRRDNRCGSRRPRERRDKSAEPSHAGPADERPPAGEASYAVQEARGPAAVNIVGPAAWAENPHAFGVALDRGASKVPLDPPPPDTSSECYYCGRTLPCRCEAA